MVKFLAWMPFILTGFSWFISDPPVKCCDTDDFYLMWYSL